MRIRKKEMENIMSKEDIDIDTNLTEDDGLGEDMDMGLDNNDLNDDFFGETDHIPLEKYKDLLKELTDFAPYLKDAFNNWLGLAWSEDKKQFVPNPLITPIMNIKGAAWCSGYLRTYTRSNNIITDISADEYKNIMSDHIEAIWLNIGTREDLGIKEDGDLIRVANELEHAAALVLMGAGEGKYNKFLGTIIHQNINSNISPNQPVNNFLQPQIQSQRGVIGKIRKVLVG